MTVALANSNPLVLSAMAEIFDRDPRFSLVTTSASAERFLGAVMRIGVTVGVIDWALPALGGQRLIEVLRDHARSSRRKINEIASQLLLAEETLNGLHGAFLNRAKTK